MPLAAFIYFLCYLDRSNIGNAKVLNTSTKNDMQSETGMTSYEFNLALMIFLIGCEFSCSREIIPGLIHLALPAP